MIFFDTLSLSLYFYTNLNFSEYPQGHRMRRRSRKSFGGMTEKLRREAENTIPRVNTPKTGSIKKRKIDQVTIRCMNFYKVKTSGNPL